MFDASGVGSGGDDNRPDASTPNPDGQTAPDGSVDAALDPDAATGPDAQVEPDAYVQPDAQVEPDAYVQPDAYVEPDAAPPDSDGDGEPDVTDNCPNTPNPGQQDLDSDGDGDACDSDADGDLIPEAHDPDDLHYHTLLYYNDFSTQPDDFEAYGTWTYQGDSLCQTTASSWPRVRLYDAELPENDMVVETVMTVTDADLGHADWASAGVGVRSVSTGSDSYHSYLCCLDLDGGRLVILRSDGSYISELAATPSDSVSVPIGGTFTLRAKAEGVTIGCELLPDGTATPLSVQSEALASGTAGMFTYRAAACWDYLLVYAP